MASKNILCLDLGSVTGWAASSSPVTSGTLSFKSQRFESGGMRYLRFKRWLDEILETSGGISEVYFEEVRRHAGTDAAHVYGGLMVHLTAWCEQHAIAYAGVPVGTIKKSLTGKGNASKQQIIDAVNAMGYSTTSHDEADALGLLHYVIDTTQV